jgi:hypothetical protein
VKNRTRVQMNKARAQSFMLVARTEQMQSKLESTSANLAMREADVARLTELVNELREQQCSMATKMTGGKASMQARRTHLLQLISSSHLVGGEMCHETQKTLKTGEEKEKVREMGASRVITDPTTGLSCEANAYAVLLASADDDHLMSKLIESEARVDELMKECTTLRTQQVVSGRIINLRHLFEYAGRNLIYVTTNNTGRHDLHLRTRKRQKERSIAGPTQGASGEFHREAE